MTNRIAFPGLGLDFEISRVAFEIFGKPIFWYAIIIATGFLLAVFYGLKRSSEFSLSEDNIMNMLVLAVPFAIIFARVYYVVFNFSEYAGDPIRVLYIWEGGIAIYGAIIGAVIGALIYCRFAKVSFLDIADIGALGLLIGQAVGRWGNFVNAEAYGGVTDVLWRMELYDAAAGARICVHPTFLYESLWNALGFVLLHFYSKRKKFRGEIFLLYTAWYGLGRAFIEGMRQDSLYLFNTGIRVSQALAIIVLVASVGILIYNYVRKKTEVES